MKPLYRATFLLLVFLSCNVTSGLGVGDGVVIAPVVGASIHIVNITPTVVSPGELVQFAVTVEYNSPWPAGAISIGGRDPALPETFYSAYAEPLTVSLGSSAATVFQSQCISPMDDGGRCIASGYANYQLPLYQNLAGSTFQIVARLWEDYLTPSWVEDIVTYRETGGIYSLVEQPSPSTSPFERFPPNKPFEVRQGPVLLPGRSEPVVISYAVVDGLAIFEGDIVLGRADEIAFPSSSQSIIGNGRPQGIGVLPSASFLWPNQIVPYVISSLLSATKAAEIGQAIQHWEANSSLTFVNRTSETDYLEFTTSDGCWSFVGRRGGMQSVGLAAGCGFGSIVHEIGHAIGLWHEQSRCDRDNFVRILWQNITPGQEHNFNNECASGFDIGSYDYGSIMHYPTWAFSATPGASTIETIPPGIPIGNRDGLSAGDIAAVRFLYGTTVPPPPPPPPTGLSIERFLDANGNGYLDDDEILVALKYWIRGEEVPGTGQFITDEKMVILLSRKWVMGEPLFPTPPTNPQPPAPPSGPHMAISPSSGPEGTEFTIHFSGFTAGGTFDATFIGPDGEWYWILGFEVEPLMNVFGGAYTFKTCSMAAGIHTIQAVESQTGRTASPIFFTVLESRLSDCPRITYVNAPATMVVHQATRWSLGFSSEKNIRRIYFYIWRDGSWKLDSFLEPNIQSSPQGIIEVETTCNTLGTNKYRVTIEDELYNGSRGVDYTVECIETSTQPK